MEFLDNGGHSRKYFSVCPQESLRKYSFSRTVVLLQYLKLASAFSYISVARSKAHKFVLARSPASESQSIMHNTVICPEAGSSFQVRWWPESLMVKQTTWGYHDQLLRRLCTGTYHPKLTIFYHFCLWGVFPLPHRSSTVAFHMLLHKISHSITLWTIINCAFSRPIEIAIWTFLPTWTWGE